MRAFNDFAASGVKTSDIARLDSTRPLGAELHVTRGSGDKAYALFRSDASKADNNSVRAAFKNAIANNRTDSLNLSKDENGNIVIKALTGFNSGSIVLTNEKKVPNVFSTDRGSSIEYSLNVVVTGESLEKLANADWTDFDSDANKKIENDITLPHSVERAADTLPDDFKLDVKVDVSFSINVNRLADLV